MLLVTTHLDCFSFLITNTLITMEITSPIIAMANSVTKAMFTPLQSSELLSLE